MPSRPPRGARTTARDLEILEDLRLSTALGVEHLVALGYFSGISRARRRLAQMESSGLVRRLWVADGSPSARSVFAVAPGAADVLAARLGLDRAEVARLARRPFGRMLVEHSLGVARTRAALARPGSGVAFLQEPLVRHEYRVAADGKAETRAFRPDGLFRVGGDRPLAAFLEFDRGSVSLGKWAGVVRSYADYLRLGLFAAEYGDDSPAVLVVGTAGSRRIAHLSRIALKSDGPAFWFACLEDVERGGLDGRCWVREPGGTPRSLAEIARGATS